jgi:hypothetical protein
VFNLHNVLYKSPCEWSTLRIIVDLVSASGYLTVGGRIRQVGEKLQVDVQVLCQ